MGPLARHAVVVAIGGLLGCATSQAGLHREAVATLAREDARGFGSAALARHPNPYVRVESLRRMQARAAQLDDAEVAAAAAALEDETPIFDESCRDTMDGPRAGAPLPGSGYNPGGQCRQAADSSAVYAATLLRAAPADRVARAIVAQAVALQRPILGPAERDILHARGPQASAALLDALATPLASADPKTAAALLQAAAFAAPGSGSPAAVALIVRAMNAPDERVQARARAALLRLTDRPGPEPAPSTTPPRATAVSALAAQIAAEYRAGARSQALPALADIGPSAAPLLDAMLPVLSSRTLEVLEAVKAIGPRARRATAALIAYDKIVFSQRSYEDVDRYHVLTLDALVAIDAPAADVEALARRHLDGSKELMLSALTALGAVGAKVTAEELDGWEAAYGAECSRGRLVRMGPDSADECMRLAETIAALRKSNGVKPRP
jgi:hypothetical protein